MGKTYVIGDIHGAYRALRQCLEKSGFHYHHDHLICLGDVADGWPETRLCIDELLKIENVTYILGNHDFWALKWMETKLIEDIWYEQGGKATIDSYRNGLPESHTQFLKEALPYFVLHNKLFVHAGIDPLTPLEAHSFDVLLWDRNLARMALDFYEKDIAVQFTTYDEIYIGHTPISSPQPIQACEVWLMDTGAGWHGRLSMMNIETKEMFISDPVPTLYPGVEGRKKINR
jgi:serine/threonine protein phosphatase 1